jgi:NADH-quinone oxidoreductase subunit L
VHTWFAYAILLLPLAGFALNALAGARLGRASGVLGSALVLAAFAVAAWAFVASLGDHGAPSSVVWFTWVAAGGVSIPFGTLIDPLSLVWALVITGVGGLIHVYSNGYMHDDPGLPRFFAYLNLFVFAMLLLVLASNFLILLIGWAGVGLASYLLIGFWYTRPSAVRAAKKAFVVNVVGDVGIMIAIFLLAVHLGTVTYPGVFGAVASHTLSGATLEWVAAMLLLGAMAKSAQFPLHTWLPDAMEGPTPVSALIHAATMVTAGVYLVARAYPIFHAAHVVSGIVLDLGTFTAIFAAVIALTQNDIKRVLAYSTLSQLGYMFMAVGAGLYAAGVFHFLTHAFFKALLFLGAGSVIHALHDEQDLRKMGGLAKVMPVTYWTFLAATLAIAGIPPFAGFFSKDAILGQLLSSGHDVEWVVGVVTAGLTALYMFRLFFLAFHGEYRGDRHPHESSPVILVPLVILGALSVVGGWLAVPGGWDLVARYLGPVFSAFPGGRLPATVTAPNWGSEVISVLFALAGIALANAMYRSRSFAPERLRSAFPGLYRAAAHKFYVDEAYEAVVVAPARWLGRALGDWLDPRAVDGAVQAVGGLAWLSGAGLDRLQAGSVRRYTLTLLTGTLFVILALALR